MIPRSRFSRTLVYRAFGIGLIALLSALPATLRAEDSAAATLLKCIGG